MEQYKPYAPPLTQAPVPNPHSPATAGYKPQPVEIPGVLDQTRRLYQSYQPAKDTK